MRIEPVEIYSDASNAAVLRHPGRKFPGVLVQGDTLQSLVAIAQDALEASDSLDDDIRENVVELAEKLQDLLQHYESTLLAHGLELPYPQFKA